MPRVYRRRVYSLWYVAHDFARLHFSRRLGSEHNVSKCRIFVLVRLWSLLELFGRLDGVNEPNGDKVNVREGVVDVVEVDDEVTPVAELEGGPHPRGRVVVGRVVEDVDVRGEEERVAHERAQVAVLAFEVLGVDEGEVLDDLLGLAVPLEAVVNEPGVKSATSYLKLHISKTNCNKP